MPLTSEVMHGSMLIGPGQGVAIAVCQRVEMTTLPARTVCRISADIESYPANSP